MLKRLDTSDFPVDSFGIHLVVHDSWHEVLVPPALDQVRLKSVHLLHPFKQIKDRSWEEVNLLSRAFNKQIFLLLLCRDSELILKRY